MACKLTNSKVIISTALEIDKMVLLTINCAITAVYLFLQYILNYQVPNEHIQNPSQHFEST